jgi:hypothetical protein
MIRDYNAAQHYRFYGGSDKNFVGEPYDFSGVGYSNAGHWATLVSNNYFISATHYHPGTGETVTFWATNDLTGPSYTYTVAGGSRIGTTDLWVGRFDTTVDSSIARYPLAMEPSASDYIDLVLYNYGLNQRVGRNVLEDLGSITVSPSTGVAAWYDYDNNDSPSVGGDETFLQAGDSGAPSFTILNSELSLIGVHWAVSTYLDGSPYGSIDTFVPEYYDDVNAVLATGGQTLTAVPEPSAYWYALIIACSLGLSRRRRRNSP